MDHELTLADLPPAAGPDAPDGVPANLAAEETLLGALLMQTPAYDAVADAVQYLEDGDLYQPAHETIWQTVLDLYGHGHPTTVPAITAHLRTSGNLARVGGDAYLHALARQACPAANVAFYAQAIHGQAVLRRFKETLVRGMQMLRTTDPDSTGDTLTSHIAEVEQLLADDAHQEGDFVRWGETLDAHLDALAQPPAPPMAITGFTDLDALMRLEPGQLLVAAGRPAMGKSAFALGCAVANARKGNPTLVASMEMGPTEISNRILAARSRILFEHLKGGRDEITEGDWDSIDRHTSELRGLPLWMDYNARTSPARLRSRIKTLTRESGRAPLVVVDYLQLMQTDQRNPRQSPYEKATEISRELKLLAMETGTVIIALAQLNRGPEQRNDKKPLMSDLRDSGALEQDADAVILLHRDDYYQRESPRAGETDLIVAKHRNGATTSITVAHQFHYSRLRDMAGGF